MHEQTNAAFLVIIVETLANFFFPSPSMLISKTFIPKQTRETCYVYLKESLSVIRRSDLEKDFSGECLWLELLLPKAKGILFGTFYRPPSQSDFLDPFQEQLDCVSAENKEMLITGDFNFDLLNTSCPKPTRDLKGIFSSFNLAQLIDKATRITKDSATLLDLFATNVPRNITLAKVIPSTLSDHDMLMVVRKINANTLPPRTIECRNFSS